MEQLIYLLTYFDKSEKIAYIRKECNSFLREASLITCPKYLPWRFLIEIDWMDLQNECPVLGELMLNEPFKLINMCKDIVHASILSTDDEKDYVGVEYSQVHVTLRLKSISKLAIPQNSYYVSGMVSYEGMIISMSQPAHYVYHTVWSCPEDCEGSDVVMSRMPKLPPRCYVCRNNLYENSNSRRCGEKVTVTIISGQNVVRPIVIKDDLIPKLELGGRYIFTGIVDRKVVSALSVEKVQTLAIPRTFQSPSDIDQLFIQCNETSWKYIYCLSSSLGVNVCPLNNFMHLKISLLLSLTSIGANAISNSPIVHVLVAGMDTSFVGRIMSEAASLAQHAIFLSSGTQVSNALLYSTEGVCVLPLPLYTYTQKQLSSVLSAVESNEVTVDKMRSKLRCAVWAQGMDYKKIILYNIANVFGFVCRGDYGQNDDEIVDFLLQNAVEPVENKREKLRILKDLTNLIDIVSNIKVKIGKESESLIRKYFLSARRESPRAVFIGSIMGLIATSITIARLCRRSETNIDDAVFAIWLHVSGSPEPRFAPEEYLQSPDNIKKLHNIMLKFKDWLSCFVGNY